MSLLAAERRVNEEIDHIERKTRTYNSAAETKDICIVMESCHARGESICAVCSSDSPDLICRHRDADAGTAAENAELALAGRDCLARYLRKNSIVNGLVAVSSEVLDIKASLSEDDRGSENWD